MEMRVPPGGVPPSRGSWGFLSSAIEVQRGARKERQNVRKESRAGFRGLCFYFTLRRGRSASLEPRTKLLNLFTLLGHFCEGSGAAGGGGKTGVKTHMRERLSI